MLTPSAIAASHGTAEVLAERGVRLVPIAETPLSVLVQCALKSAVVQAQYGSADAQPEFASVLADGANTADALNVNGHDVMMAEAVNEVGRVINFNNQLAKNVVNPAVERVAGRLAKALEAFDANAATPVAIQQAHDDTFWRTPYVQELFGRYQETVAQNVTVSTPAIAFSETYFQTGIASFDEAIASYLERLRSNGQLEKIWSESFARGAFKSADVFSGEPADVINAGIVVYLAAGNLEENPPEGTNQSAGEWSTMLRTLKGQAGRVVCRGLANLDRSRSLNQLIRSYPPVAVPGSVIVVDGAVYAKFLAEGGTPEAVLGAFFTDRNRDYAKLLADGPAYANHWKIAQTALVSEAVAVRHTAVIVELERAVGAEINELSDEHMVIGRDALHALLREHLRLVRVKDMEDLWDVSRRVICRVLFPHTDAEATLLAIDEQKRAQPNLSVREAALYASIDQLAKWLAKLITVESVKV